MLITILTHIKMIKILLLFFVGLSYLGYAQEPYTLAPESVLAINGTSTVHDWEVAANSIKGSLTVTGGIISDLNLEIPVAEIKSERGATMDAKMHTALKAEEYLNVYFSADEYKENAILTGNLSIAGIEQEVGVTIEFTRKNDKISISGTEEIVLADYGITPPTAMFGQIIVGDTVTIKFDLSFLRE